MNDIPNKKPCCPPELANVIEVETTAGIKGLSNCFVYVNSINTSYYIDSKHRITIISSMPVYVDGYDYATNPLGLRSQTCYDFLNDRMIVYDAHGNYRTLSLNGGNNE